MIFEESLWEDRIRQVNGIRLVAWAADPATAQANVPRTLPAAVVLAERYRGGTDFTMSVVSQWITVTVPIALVLRHASGATGAEAKREMNTLRKAVFMALVAWDPYDEPVYYESGAMALWKDGLMWWVDNYNTRFLSR